MTLEEVKTAVDSGRVVHWKNPAYTVYKEPWGAYRVKCSLNGYVMGIGCIDVEGCYVEL